ncbi:SGNH hydrolase [Sanghuangporus baumii]|uniref:SGNH hydrolase n=1 Tax=Sanghuangporus baumii TaxID=108892 RepID=A0A9Q5I0Z8_SANBA|nr:SGNH hydrolase [Sanghuangporus baumii]
MTAPVQDAIVLLGDSLTQGGWEAHGFAQRLACESAYVRKFDVINRGFSGYNTEWTIPVFEQCLARRNEQSSAQKIRLLTIWYGANDATLPGFRQHIPLEKFGANLTRLVNMVRDPSSEWFSSETKLFLITPPPFNVHQWVAGTNSAGVPHERDRDFKVTAEYAQKVREVGASEKIPVVDVWRALWNIAGQTERGLTKYLSDGLHLTGEGYSVGTKQLSNILRDLLTRNPFVFKVVYEELIGAIKEYTPELYYENLQEVFVK